MDRADWVYFRLSGPPRLTGPWMDISLRLLLLPVATITAAAWSLDLLARRHTRRGHCPTCHYDRRGLPPTAPCPECGTPPPPAA
jgi:hypothetical protein